MDRLVELGTANTVGSRTRDKGYYLPDADGESPNGARPEPSGRSKRTLIYILSGIALLFLILLLLVVFAGSSLRPCSASRAGSIVKEIEQENALIGFQTDQEREEIMRQAQRVDRAEALGDAALTKRELEKLLALDKGNAESTLHKICVKRLCAYK